LSRFGFLAIISTSSLLLGATAARAQSNFELCDAQINAMCGNRSITECFRPSSSWQSIDSRCLNDVEMLIENERAAGLGQNNDRPRKNGGQDQAQSANSAVSMAGMSYGGVLRVGPGMEHPKLASVLEGDQVEVLEDTGVWFNDYKWFRVTTPAGEGYHWGGIFCVHATRAPEGVFGVCQ